VQIFVRIVGTETVPDIEPVVSLVDDVHVGDDDGEEDDEDEEEEDDEGDVCGDVDDNRSTSQLNSNLEFRFPTVRSPSRFHFQARTLDYLGHFHLHLQIEPRLQDQLQDRLHLGQFHLLIRHCQ